MKIIQERKSFESWILQIDCTGGTWNQDKKVPCGSTLEIDVNDLLKRDWSKYPDYEGTSYGFICPICGCFTDIDETLLNDSLKKMAQDYFKAIEMNRVLDIK